MWRTKEVRFASDHPSAAGHFPSHPIIPGALLLDEAIKLMTEGAQQDREIVVRAAKFFRPVRPGEAIMVRWEVTRAETIKFECRLIGDNRLVASGTVETGPARR